MVKLAIKPENQKQSLLFPPCLDELIPKTHVVRVVNEIIDRLDTSSLKESYKGGGNSCYSPKMMLKLLVNCPPKKLDSLFFLAHFILLIHSEM